MSFPITTAPVPLRSRDAAVALLLALLTLAAFWPVLANGFVSYDDPGYVTDNPQVARGLGPPGVAWAFTTGDLGNWHPLTWLSHMADVSLFGQDPRGHHLSSLVLHLTSVLLLFLFLRSATGATWRSGFVAALFAVHPTRVESVAWIAERKDVLSAVFLMLTLIAWQRYLRHPGAGRYFAAAGLLACGLMAKPMLVSVPFLLLLLDVWPLRRFEHLTAPARFGSLAHLGRLAVEKLPLVALAAVSAAVTVVVQRSGAAVKSLDQYPLGDRLANAVLAWTGYVGKLVRPVDLAFFYPYRREFPAIEVGLGTAALIGVSAAAVLLRRRWPYVFTGWFWYWGMLVPVIGIVQVGGQSMADRYLYVPAIGLFVVAVWGGADIVARLPRGRTVLAVLGLLVVLALIPLTRAQTRTWNDGATLYRHALAVTENNYVALDLLGVEFLRRGELDAAIARFEGALAFAPAYAPAHNNLGVALAGQGRYRDAIPQYRAALTAAPDYGEAHNNLGIALASVGEVDEALEQFADARRLDPDDPEVLRNLGIAWSMKGDTARSLKALRAALDRRPDWNDVALKVARILATDPDPALRDGPEAVRLAEHACSAQGGRNARCLETLAAAYAEAGRWDDAVRVIERAIELAGAGGTAVPPARLRERLARYHERRPLRDGGAEGF